MQLFLVAFQQPIPFGISAAVVTLMIFIMLKAALSSEGGARWVRRVTNTNAKFLFTFLFIGWAIFFGIGLQLVPHTGANSPYGGIGLRLYTADRRRHPYPIARMLRPAPANGPGAPSLLGRARFRNFQLQHGTFSLRHDFTARAWFCELTDVPPLASERTESDL